MHRPSLFGVLTSHFPDIFIQRALPPGDCFCCVTDSGSFFPGVEFKFLEYMGPVLTTVTSTKGPEPALGASFKSDRQGGEAGQEGKG